MGLENNVTKGELRILIGENGKINVSNVLCSLYSLKFLKLKGSGEDGVELNIDISEGEDIEQGKTYKLDGSNQSSAYYRDEDGQQLRLKGDVKLNTFNTKGGIVIFSFELESLDADPKIRLNGDGDFKGINIL